MKYNENMLSYWEKYHWFSTYDYVIIGSGIVGISTSIEIKERFPNKTVIVIDAGAIPTGASTKNAGFTCFGTVGEILDDLTNQSSEDVRQTIKMRWDGLLLLKKRLNNNLMNYKALGGHEVFAVKNAFDMYEAKLKAINNLIYDSIGKRNVLRVKKQSISSNLYEYSFFNDLEGQLNPVLMMKSLIKIALKLGIEVVNNFKVVGFNDDDSNVSIQLGRGMTISAKKLIVCTNAFSKKLLPNVDVIPARNQVLVTKSIDDLKIKGAFHFDNGYVYFRNIGNRLLVGGARNLDKSNEMTSEFNENSKIINHLVSFIKNELNIPEFIIENKWSGIIATGQSKKPHIQKHTTNVFSAVRLGGMGVAIGSQVALDVVNLILAD